MWLSLALISATMLGFYDVAKKYSLKDNAVLPVLLLNTVFSTIIFSPTILDSAFELGWFTDTIFESDMYGLKEHLRVILKAFIVLSSWICGYFAIKHLPLSLVGPMNAVRPVFVLLGALLIFGERLNIYQWIGVILSFVSIFLLSLISKKEGVNFKSNKWVLILGLAVLLGATSGLYDKYIMRDMNPVFVQGWFNLYQMIIMCVLVPLLWWPKRKSTTPFKFRWSILLISMFICMADFAYFNALSDSEAMISVVSTIRRGSVIVSFCCAALFFHEKQLKRKAIDLLLVLIGMAFLYWGSK